MILNRLSLFNFRNFTSVVHDIHPLLTIVAGENARGKTNLLESVYFLITGSGFRETREDELIRWGELSATVDSIFMDGDTEFRFRITLNNQLRMTKTYSVNGTGKRHVQYLEFMTRCVLFAPEHVDIIDRGPEKRRGYVDVVLCSVDLEYKKKLQNYEQALRRRNKVLEEHESVDSLKEELKFWNSYLAEHARYLTEQRVAYIAYLNKNNKLQDKSFVVDYTPNELTVERLQEYFDKERGARRTLIGPQKDDFVVNATWGTKKNLYMFGSRSEQRLAVLWLKLCEIRYIEDVLHRKPILLLDDIFSEFDSKNKRFILDLIGRYQTIITTTEPELADVTTTEKSIITFT